MDALLKSAWVGQARNYYHKYFDTKRELAWARRYARSRADLAASATWFGDHAQGIEQIDAYRSAMRIWRRLIENRDDANWIAAHIDGGLGRASGDVQRLAKVFGEAEDWPDEQTALNIAEQLAGVSAAGHLQAR